MFHESYDESRRLPCGCLPRYLNSTLAEVVLRPDGSWDSIEVQKHVAGCDGQGRERYHERVHHKAVERLRRADREFVDQPRPIEDRPDWFWLEWVRRPSQRGSGDDGPRPD